jgi:hypothetical protein
MLNPNSSFDTDFIAEIAKILEFVFVFVYKCLQVENATENCPLDNDDLFSSSSADMPFNRVPLQQLFNKYSFLTANKSNSTIQFRHILALFDRFQFLTNFILLWSHMQDQLVHLYQNADFLYLNRLMELLLHELFVSSRNVTSRQLALNYLATNPRLAKCVFSVMLAPNSTKSVYSYINSKLTVNEIFKNRFYSPSALHASLYTRLVQVFDQLESSLDTLKPLVNLYHTSNVFAHEYVGGLGNRAITSLLDSANLIQSLNFLINIDSNIADGN